MSVACQSHDLHTSMAPALPPIGTKMIEMVTETRALTGQSWEGTTLGHADHCAFHGDILITSSGFFVFPHHTFNPIDAINNNVT